MAYASHRELPSNAQFLRIFLIKKNILGTLSVHEILQALLNLCYFVTSFKNIPICAWTFVYYSHSLGGVFVNVRGFSIFLETKGTNIYTAQIQVLDTNRFRSLRQYILFLSVP